jgi:hypothetical protein
VLLFVAGLLQNVADVADVAATETRKPLVCMGLTDHSLGLGSGAARRGGSSPFTRTIKLLYIIYNDLRMDVGSVWKLCILWTK